MASSYIQEVLSTNAQPPVCLCPQRHLGHCCISPGYGSEVRWGDTGLSPSAACHYQTD